MDRTGAWVCVSVYGVAATALKPGDVLAVTAPRLATARLGALTYPAVRVEHPAATLAVNGKAIDPARLARPAAAFSAAAK